ncbi:MAG TPA: ABC transporter permease [Gemmatimonadales bacterium]|jgi:predicted permease
MRNVFAQWTTDLRHAWRGLRRAPGFAVIAIGTLGLAIGANAGIFSVVNTVLIHPLPYQNLDRILFIAGTAPGSDMPAEFGVSPELYLQYQQRSRLLDDVALFSSFTSTLRAGDRVERIRMSQPTPNLFTTLGAHPVLGRLPVASDESNVAVISYELWQTWFGRDPNVIGKTFQISGRSRTVIGVMGNDFQFPRDGTMLWFPLTVRLTDLDPQDLEWAMVGRMKPGVTATAAASELTTLARETPTRFGGPVSYSRLMANYRAVVRPLSQAMLGDVRQPLWVLFGAVTIVLLIACANVANLFVVRGEGRLRELAVRRAIGAGRGALIRLQMAEALVVAVAAGVVATVLALIFLPLLVHGAPTDIPRIGTVHVDAAMLLYTLVAAIVAALACGLGPALRGAAAEFGRLREGGRGNTTRRAWLRNALVVGQTALALVLLISSGLLMRSFARLTHVNPGYDTHDVFTFQIAPDRPTLSDGPTFAQFQLTFMERLRALPGVRSVGLVDNIPLDEGTSLARFRTEGQPVTDPGTLVSYVLSAGDYFKAMAIPVLRGRPLTDAEASTSGHVVVSQSAAKLLWPGQDPIGHRLQFSDDSSWNTVVGEVGDVLQDGFRSKPQAVIYTSMVGQTPKSWAASSPAYAIKTSRAETIAPEVRALVHELAPEAPMYRVYTMAELARRDVSSLSFMMLTLGIASVLALILGAVGLYGVLSYVVAQRTREIGVRMALGAEAGQVRRMVVGQGTSVVAIGVVIGLVTALIATRALGSMLYQTGAIDPVTFIVMSLALLGVGVLASYLPARRASSVSPLESLRGE